MDFYKSDIVSLCCCPWFINNHMHFIHWDVFDIIVKNLCQYCEKHDPQIMLNLSIFIARLNIEKGSPIV